MNARLLVNLGLLVLCAVLGWFALRTNTPAPTPPTTTLTTLTASQIASIQIERDGATVAQLQRSGDGWRIETPVSAAADVFRVQTLIGLALARSQIRFRAAGNDLTQYGLQPARATVRFNDTVLLIGDANPVDGYRYVLSDRQVHLLEDNWFSPIFGSGIAWLDPRLLPHDATPEAIELRPKPGVMLRWHLAKDRWRRTPTHSTSDAQTAHQRGLALTNAWRQARALSVQRRDPALAWNARAIVTFKRAAQSPKATTNETIGFVLTRTKDALFFAREDLDVQYRFLPRQGQALLDTRDKP
ncbi:MAG: hypothetical protein ACI9DC_002044 [Gammaproteobacteria bacterium]|jgi:hypothetical protein